MMINKRGISTIIATVLVLLLTIVAASMLFGFVVPFVKNSLDSGDCIKTLEYFSFDNEIAGYNCYNYSAGLAAVTIKAKDNQKISEDINGLSLLLITDTEDSIKININDNAAVSNALNGARMIDANAEATILAKNGEIRTYVINTGLNLIKTAEVYPVLKGKTCEGKNDEIELVSCESKGLNLP